MVQNYLLPFTGSFPSLKMCLVTVLCKVFPLKAPAALFSPLQLFPVAILQQCREDQLLYYQQQDPVDSEGKNAGKRQHL